MKKSLLNVKSEKGSVTVFVLIAILFFTVVLTTLYASNMNILSSQNKNIETLASNYKQSIEGMDAMYQQLADRENATFVTGENFNIALKKAAGESGATTSSTDTKIKTITFDRYTNQLEKVKNKTGVAVDSGNNGDIKIYVIKNESNDYEAYVLSSNGEFNLNKNASSMFKNLTVLEKINNLTSVHTALTENISDMFSGCSALLEADISSFNTAKLTNTANMFNGCTNLKTIYASTTWSIDGITSSTNMFTNCTSLVGGYGTTYNSSITDKTYARIDSGVLPGYFSTVNEKNGYITQGLIRLYDGKYNNGPLHDSETTVWKDLSGNCDGIMSNCQCNEDNISFNGTNSYVNCGIYTGAQLTCEMKFNATTIPTKYEGSLFMNAESGGAGFNVINGKVRMGIFVSGRYHYVGTDINIGKNYIVTSTYDGSVLKLYLNGELKDSLSIIGDISPPLDNTVWMIGTNPSGTVAGGNFFNGKIYRVSLYNRALTGEEVKINYNTY